MVRYIRLNVLSDTWEKNVALSAAILSPVPDIRSSKFSTFSNEVRLNYKFEVSYYGAAAYDACWLFALAVIDAGSLETDAIKQSLEKIALDYEGVSGLCSFNEDGDRSRADYIIMGYREGGFKEYGYYTYSNNTIKFTWKHQKIPSG